MFTLRNTTPICGAESKKSAEVPKNIVFMSTDIRLKKRDNMFQQTSDLSCLEEDNLQTQEPPWPIQPKSQINHQHPLSKAGVAAPNVPVDNASPPLVIKDLTRQKTSNSTEMEFMLLSKGIKQVKPKEIMKDFEDYNKFTELTTFDEKSEDNASHSFENLCLFKPNQKGLNK